LPLLMMSSVALVCPAAADSFLRLRVSCRPLSLVGFGKEGARRRTAAGAIEIARFSRAAPFPDFTGLNSARSRPRGKSLL